MRPYSRLVLRDLSHLWSPSRLWGQQALSDLVCLEDRLDLWDRCDLWDPSRPYLPHCQQDLSSRWDPCGLWDLWDLEVLWVQEDPVRPLVRLDPEDPSIRNHLLGLSRRIPWDRAVL